MARTGRPRIEIDKGQFEKLCGLMCTQEEIAGFFGCSEDTVTNWCKREYGETFSEVSKKLQHMGKISLRRAQFKLAEKNAAMAIFLGKNYLGQRDNPKEDIDEAARQIIEAVGRALGDVDSVIE